MHEIMISKVCIVVALIALLIYLYGFLITITTQEKNTCEMTYMFEYPQFVVSKKQLRWFFIFSPTCVGIAFVVSLFLLLGNWQLLGKKVCGFLLLVSSFPTSMIPSTLNMIFILQFDSILAIIQVLSDANYALCQNILKRNIYWNLKLK